VGSSPRRVSLPLSSQDASSLRVGDEVLLTGPVFTARDATHARLVAELDTLGVLPYGLEGHVLFYAGPTPAAAGRPVGSVGPTTAKRMDSFTPALLAAGVRGMIGKGVRSQAVREACALQGAVYFAAVGGSAALLATRVVSSQTIAYAELGTEALVRMELQDFPVFVAIDAMGNDLYASAADEWRSRSAEESS